MWRAYSGVTHCVFDQIPNLQNCSTTPNKNQRGEGASDWKTPAAKYLYWLIFKKSGHLGFGVFIDIWSMLTWKVWVRHSLLLSPRLNIKLSDPHLDNFHSSSSQLKKSGILAVYMYIEIPYCMWNLCMVHFDILLSLVLCTSYWSVSLIIIMNHHTCLHDKNMGWYLWTAPWILLTAYLDDNCGWRHGTLCLLMFSW